MLICGHCGDTVKDLHGLSVHLRCEEKPLELVVVENTSTNTQKPCASQIAAEMQYFEDTMVCGQNDELRDKLGQWRRQLRLL